VLGLRAEVLQFQAEVLSPHAGLWGVQCRGQCWPKELRVVDFVDAGLAELGWRQAEALHVSTWLRLTSGTT
jgi:hypothetical protein